MQTSIFYREEDAYLIKLARSRAKRERKSLAAVILEALEVYLERGRSVLEILQDMEAITKEKIVELEGIAREGRIPLESLVKEAVGEEKWERAIFVHNRASQKD